MGRPKLAQGLVDRAIALKRDGLSNRGIICALGIHESTFYRWIGDPKNKLQRELSEGLKRRRRRSSRRCSPRSAPPSWRATSIGPPRRGFWSASTPTSTARPTELTANRKTPAETAAMAVEALTFADEPGGDPYQHDELIWCDDTPDGKQSMAVWRRDFGLRAHPARKSKVRRLSYEWLAGLREIVIDPVRCPLTLEEFRLKEYARDRDGTWIDDIPDGNDHSIDAVRYAMMDDALRG